MDEISKKCGGGYMTSSSSFVNWTQDIPFIYVIIKKNAQSAGLGWDFFFFFFKLCTFLSVLADDFLTFFLLQSPKIFVYSSKNICEPLSEKSLFDYLSGSFHSSLIFLCKYIYEHKLFSLPISSLQKAGEKRLTLHEWLASIYSLQKYNLHVCAVLVHLRNHPLC